MFGRANPSTDTAIGISGGRQFGRARKGDSVRMDGQMDGWIFRQKVPCVCRGRPSPGTPERRRTVACGSREVFGDQVPRPDASSRERVSPTRGRSSSILARSSDLMGLRDLYLTPLPLSTRGAPAFSAKRKSPAPGWGGALGLLERVLPESKLYCFLLLGIDFFLGPRNPRG